MMRQYTVRIAVLLTTLASGCITVSREATVPPGTYRTCSQTTNPFAPCYPDERLPVLPLAANAAASEQ